MERGEGDARLVGLDLEPVGAVGVAEGAGLNDGVRVQAGRDVEVVGPQQVVHDLQREDLPLRVGPVGGVRGKIRVPLGAG